MWYYFGLYVTMQWSLGSTVFSCLRSNKADFKKLRKELMPIAFHFYCPKRFFNIITVCFCFYGDQPPRWMGHPEIKSRFLLYVIKKRKCQFSPATQSLIQPLLDPFEHNLSQNSHIKRLLQPTLGHISTLGSKLSLGNWRYWPWFKGAKLDSKIGLSLKRTHF